MSPVKVFGHPMLTNVARVLLFLEEVGAEYELVPMSRNGGDHRRPEHLARNPFGEIPVLEDGGLTLYQSRAIARHILRKLKPIVWNCIKRRPPAHDGLEYGLQLVGIHVDPYIHHRRLGEVACSQKLGFVLTENIR